MRDILVMVLFCAAVIPALTRPWLGILIWACFEYMNPHRLTFGFAYTFPFVYVSAIVTLVGLGLSGEPKRFPFTRETFVLILFSLWITISTYFALNQAGAWIAWDRAIKIQLFNFAVLVIMRSPQRIHSLIWMIAVGIDFYAIKGGIFTLLNGGGDMVRGPDNSFISDNNDLALATVTVIPLLRYLQLTTEKKWVRLGLTGAMVLSVVSVVASYSRAGMIALAAVLVFMILKSRRKVVLTGVLVAAVYFTLTFMPEKWFDRMNSIQDYETDASAIGRLNAWSFAWNMALDRPITGGGFQVFTRYFFRTTDYADDPNNVHEAHSIFLKILAEHGFPGLILFLSMGFFAWRSIVWIRRRARDDPDQLWAADLASMMQVALVGYSVGGAFSNLAYFDLPYNLLAIIVLTRLYLWETPVTVKAPVPEDSETEEKAFPTGLKVAEETQ